MDATALLQSTLAIQIHAVSAVGALFLGTLVLLLEKGTRLHKILGRIWVGLMTAVALSSFLIVEVRMFGPYSPLHILSIITLVSLASAVWAIRRGNVKGHMGTMISVYVSGLIIAGGFTLLPGRRMHAVLFADGGQMAGLVLLACLFLAAALVIARRRMARDATHS